MNIKFNWGTGIFIFIVAFLLTGFLVIYLSFNQKINLVSKDYYPKELKYQDVIDKKKNVKKFNKKITVVENVNSIQLIFPDSLMTDSVKGEILLYRPSDFESDRSYHIELNDSLVQYISTTALLKGKYKLFIDWSHLNTKYFEEFSIYIN